MTDNARVEERFAMRVEPRLLRSDSKQDVQALAKRVVAEIVKAGLCHGRTEHVARDSPP